MPSDEPVCPQIAATNGRPRLSTREWGLVVVLAAVNFTHVVDFVIVMPLGGQLMRELDLTAGQFARVVSAYGVSAAISGVLAAGLLDRYDRKKTLLGNYAAFTAATLLCGLASDYEMLLFARALAGAFGGLTAAGIMAIVGDVFEDARRGTATGAVMSAFAVASILGLPAGLELAKWFGWAAPFLAVAGMSAAVLALVWCVLPTVLKAGNANFGSPWATLYRVAAQPNHLRALGFMGLVIFAAFLMIPFLGPYFEANLGLPGKLPVVYAVAGACTLVSMNVVGRWADRWGKRRVFTVMAAAMMATILLATNLPPVNLAVAVAVASLLMVCGSGRMVPAQALVIGCVRPADRGAFLSLNTAVQSAALGLASDLGGRIVHKMPDGTLTGYPLAGALAFALTGVTILMVRTLRPAPGGQTAIGLADPAAA